MLGKGLLHHFKQVPFNLFCEFFAVYVSTKIIDNIQNANFFPSYLISSIFEVSILPKEKGCILNNFSFPIEFDPHVMEKMRFKKISFCPSGKRKTDKNKLLCLLVNMFTTQAQNERQPECVLLNAHSLVKNQFLRSTVGSVYL